jgi:hypothetical protein
MPYAPGGVPSQQPGGQQPYFVPPNAGQASYPTPPAARGNLLFLILGLSAMVAVLLVLLIWAVFLR